MYYDNCFGASNNNCEFCYEVKEKDFNKIQPVSKKFLEDCKRVSQKYKKENKNVTIIYYKCSCGCRVGIPTIYGHEIPNENLTGEFFGIPNNTFEIFYCNHCKEKTPHTYCGYRTVGK